MRHRNVYNVESFSSIETEASAYWFGFICADGCIRWNGKRKVVEVTLQQTDARHLELLRDFVCPKNKIYNKTVRRGNKVFRHVRLTISSHTIAEQLEKLGCGMKKSLNLRWPSTVPKKHLRHFMRGYFDGDGSVFFNKYFDLALSVEGNDLFLKKFRDHLLYELGISYTRLYKDKRSENRSYKKQGVDALKIMRYLYHEASIYLRRKGETFYVYRRLKCLTRKSRKKSGTLK